MPFETIYIDEMVAVCNGGEGPLGHPRVYLNLKWMGTRSPQNRVIAVSSASCTDKPFAWRCQPANPAPSYSIVSL